MAASEAVNADAKELGPEAEFVTQMVEQRAFGCGIMNGKKIVLEIRSIDSSEVDNLWAWQPQSNEDVFLFFAMEIGEKNTVGADLFRFLIATPEALLLHSSTKFKIICCTVSPRMTLWLSE